MPSFTVRVPNIKAVGPAIECIIAPSQTYIETLKISKEDLPEPVRVMALIDTGASSTVIQKGIAQKLGLSPKGIATISTPTSKDVTCEMFDVLIGFDRARLVFDGVLVIEAPLEGQEIQCLIGRDMLAVSVFIYNGYDNSFTLSI